MKKFILTLLFLLFTTTCFATDYWVYVRLEDRSGVTAEDDAGRSKRGDVVAVVPATKQFTPSNTEKAEYRIFKATLTDAQVDSMLEEWTTTTFDEDVGWVKRTPVAYRRNEIAIAPIGDSTGLSSNDPVDPANVQLSAKSESVIARYEFKRKLYLAKRPFIRLANWIVPKAFAEVVSTVNKTGEDYNTLTLWEDAKDGDLVTDTRQETAELYDDDGDLTDRLVINGSTTNATYYMKVTVPAADRHDGTDTGATVIKPDLANNTGLIEVRDPYSVIEWLNITGFDADGSWKRIYAIIIAQTYTTIQNNIIHDSNSEENQEHTGIYIYSFIGTANDKIYNNMVYNLNGTWSSPHGIESFNKDGRADFIYNNTVYNIPGVGILCRDATCYNNIVIGCSGNAFEFDAEATYDYNASSDTTATGANSINSNDASPPTTSDFVSVTGGSEDLHLASGAVELDQGVDLGTEANIDIDGRDRDSEGDTWDMGADERVSVAVTQPAQTIINIML